MDNTVFLSIIIPVYNVEKYLARCLESVFELAQRINLEIICVEDCSCDESRRILMEYAVDNPQIKVIYNEQNLGLSKSRNIGVEKATGSYIWFVDSDDWIEADCVSGVVDILKSKKPDALYFGYNTIYENDRSKSVKGSAETSEELVGKILDGKKAFEILWKNQLFDAVVWRGIYKNDFAQRIKFIEDIYHEDECFTVEMLLEAKKVIFINERVYNYFRHDGSLTINDDYYSEKRLWSLLVMIKELVKLSGKYEDASELIREKISRKIYFAKDVFCRVDSLNRGYIKSHQELKDLCLGIGGCFYNGYFPYKMSPDMLDIVNKANRVFVYGAGKVGQGFLDLLQERGVKNVCFLTTTKPTESTLCGVPIQSINYLKENADKENSLIFIMNSSETQRNKMFQMAIEYGALEDNIYMYPEVKW